MFHVLEFLTSQQLASHFSKKKKKIANLKSGLSPAGCLFHMCRIPAKFENKGNLLQMKIKDLRGTVRELVLGVKGMKKDDVIQVLLRHASDCQL